MLVVLLWDPEGNWHIFKFCGTSRVLFVPERNFSRRESFSFSFLVYGTSRFIVLEDFYRSSIRKHIKRHQPPVYGKGERGKISRTRISA